MTRLGHRETPRLQSHMWVRRVKPLLEVRGMLQVSDEAVYFQPHPNFSSDPVKRLPHSEVLRVFLRTYGAQAKALEIVTLEGGCLYLCFEATTDCERVMAVLRDKWHGVAASPTPSAEDDLSDLRRMTGLWQSGQLSNFHYLDFLNCAAGRSRNDFSQYPIFPWILQDYHSERIQLDDPSVYRDLSKPVGALNARRLEYFKERMADMTEDERFLYGTHYSTPAYVIYWLLREMPERMLRTLRVYGAESGVFHPLTRKRSFRGIDQRGR